jgi:hypothetical protein
MPFTVENEELGSDEYKKLSPQIFKSKVYKFLLCEHNGLNKKRTIESSFLFSLSTDAEAYGLVLIFRTRVVGNALFLLSSGDGALRLYLRDGLG